MTHRIDPDDPLGWRVHAPVGDITPRQGMLAGKRLVVKDLFNVAGEPTFAGCDVPLVESASCTASAVQRLLDAGAQYIGKAHMAQLAFGGWGTNRCVGAPRNPWDAKQVRVAGGSSSGSAVAVASGAAELALGSDTGGSIRIPAALCGIVGLRPSQARIPMDGVLALAPSFDSVGPMAATAVELAAAFCALANTGAVQPVPIATLRLRVIGDDDLYGAPDVIEAYRAATTLLAKAGARVEMTPMIPRPDDYVVPAGQVMGYEAWRLHGAFIERHRATADQGVLRRFDAVRGLDETVYRGALAERERMRAHFATWFEGADLLLTPTTPITAPPLEQVNEGDFTLSHYTRMANYLDLCALSLPCGYDVKGMPIGLQLVARAGEEEMLLAAALTIEALLALPPHRPPLWSGGEKA